MLSVAGGSSTPKECGIERQSEYGNNNSDADSSLVTYLGLTVAGAFREVNNTASSGKYLLFVVKL
jgi:hypothetical protein